MLTWNLRSFTSKLLAYCMLGPTQPPTLSGTGNESMHPHTLYSEGVAWQVVAPLVQLFINVGSVMAALCAVYH